MGNNPRFARLRTDPRFRKPKKQSSKVVLDERFKSLLSNEGDNQQSSSRQSPFPPNHDSRRRVRRTLMFYSQVVVSTSMEEKHRLPWMPTIYVVSIASMMTTV